MSKRRKFSAEFSVVPRAMAHSQLHFCSVYLPGKLTVLVFHESPLNGLEYQLECQVTRIVPDAIGS